MTSTLFYNLNFSLVVGSGKGVYEAKLGMLVDKVVNVFEYRHGFC